jgi:hypothetical protein
MPSSYNLIAFDLRKNRNGNRIPKKWVWGLGRLGKLGPLITVFLAEVMPLYVLPESLGHLGWGDLLSFLPTEYSGEMLV